MLTPPDGGADGGKLRYLEKPLFRRHDPIVFDALHRVVTETDGRRLISIEQSGILPGATYFNEIVPDRLHERREWFAKALQVLGSFDLIFFDPDNGLEVSSRPKGRKNSSKYLFHDEVAAAFSQGHSVLIYQHYPHVKRDFFEQSIAEVLRQMEPAAIWRFRTSHVVFFLVIHSRHATILGSAGREMTQTCDPNFLDALQLL